MEDRSRIFFHSVAFVLGFTLVFSAVGIALQTILSGVSLQATMIMRTIGGLIILAFGILMIASLRYAIPFFSSEHKLKVNKGGSSLVSSFVFGLAFAIGWTPCVGAILGSIYTLAAVSPGLGFILLLGYSLGIGVPFLVAGLFTDRLANFISKSRSALRYSSLIGGLILVALGLLVVFDYIGILAVFFLGSGTLSVAGQLNFALAFLAGIVTFFSPCILPLIPAFLSYMASQKGVEK